MNSTALPEATIAERVRAAQSRVGISALARRADVPKTMILNVVRGSLGDDAPALRRLLAAAQAVVGNQGARR